MVAGALLTGLAVSVTLSNIRQLLEVANYNSGGRLEVIADVGKPQGGCSLLQRQRDGVKEDRNPLSRCLFCS